MGPPNSVPSMGPREEVSMEMNTKGDKPEAAYSKKPPPLTKHPSTSLRSALYFQKTDALLTCVN